MNKLQNARVRDLVPISENKKEDHHFSDALLDKDRQNSLSRKRQKLARDIQQSF
jgi:hypothetical protein